MVTVDQSRKWGEERLMGKQRYRIISSKWLKGKISGEASQRGCGAPALGDLREEKLPKLFLVHLGRMCSHPGLLYQAKSCQVEPLVAKPGYCRLEEGSLD